MRINVSFIFLVKILLLVVVSQVSQVTTAYEQGNLNEEGDPSKDGDLSVISETITKTDLQDKYYRQALFHYFQGDSVQALTQVEQSKAKLDKLDSRSALFEAGLQLSAGLLQQAKETLVNFDTLLELEKQEAEKKDDEDQIEKSRKKSTKANELRLIALLSLTNQYLSQGNIIQAKDTLARIKSVPALYYQEYHVLNQLAYWPEINKDLASKPKEIIGESTPYIQLNDALRQIELAQSEQDKQSEQAELAQYTSAINALTAIKTTQWHEAKSNFWKDLFKNEDTFSSQQEKEEMAALQGQAIQDYAQLLLAQIYISQQRYELAFSELKVFPGESPYAESALFLFAFASQQVNQHDIAFNLLSLLYKKYPYSQLGWQAAELMAQQVSDEKSLAQGVSAYQTVEDFFLQRQTDLNKFSATFNQSANLLDFSSANEPSKLNNFNQFNQEKSQKSTGYFPQSIWLQQAMSDAELASLYQELISIDEQVAKLQILGDKTIWLAEIIELNQQRKQRVIAAQKMREEQGLFTQLKGERVRLAVLLDAELANGSSLKQKSTAFANEEETEWLERIDRSHNALMAIGDKKDTQEYKERLARVTGVLSWELAQQYPGRSWHHKKRLQQVDRAIAGVIAQQKNIMKISNSQGPIELSINKHRESVVQRNSLLIQLSKLREKVSVKIKEKVNAYIEEQNVILAEHVLSTRQSMAKVLEHMASADKKQSLKIAPLIDGNSAMEGGL